MVFDAKIEEMREKHASKNSVFFRLSFGSDFGWVWGGFWEGFERGLEPLGASWASSGRLFLRPVLVGRYGTGS